jgi:hypothetical protein
MNASNGTAALNQLLIDLGRSLLQYVGECWPWTGHTASVRKELLTLVERQQAGVRRLAELLLDRGTDIDFGTYPTEYTDLHYCALDFLLGELVKNASELLSDIEGTRLAVAGDAEAQSVLQSVANEQRAIVDSLKSIRSPKAIGASSMGPAPAPIV